MKTDVVHFPNYTAGDAARYTNVPYRTVLDWMRGEPGHPRVIQANGDLSFLNLVELHMLGGFSRHCGIPSKELRRAVTKLARRHPDEPHPLATRRFWIGGKSVFTEELGELVRPSKAAGWALPRIVECYAKRVHWSGSLPRRLFPFTARPAMAGDDPTRSIVIDPTVAFGRPVVAGTRIPTTTLFERFAAGEPMASIALDYGITLREVEEAIRFDAAHAST